MAYYFGGNVVKAKTDARKTSIINHDRKGIFKDIPQDIEVMLPFLGCRKSFTSKSINSHCSIKRH